MSQSSDHVNDLSKFPASRWHPMLHIQACGYRNCHHLSCSYKRGTSPLRNTNEEFRSFFAKQYLFDLHWYSYLKWFILDDWEENTLFYNSSRDTSTLLCAHIQHTQCNGQLQTNPWLYIHTWRLYLLTISTKWSRIKLCRQPSILARDLVSKWNVMTHMSEHSLSCCFLLLSGVFGLQHQPGLF